VTTTYLAAYDTEEDACRRALPQIVKIHERHAMPATFFIANRILPGHERDLRALLDNPFFEIASHTHSHDLLAPHSRGPGIATVSDRQLPDEIHGSKRRLEDCFGRPVTGFRPPWGYAEGLRHAPRVLELLASGGYRYVSSVLWGPGETLPALFCPPCTYADSGYPDLLEIPSCGWHENILKEAVVALEDVLPTDPPFPGAVPSRKLQSPEEEAAFNRLFIDRAVDLGMPHVTLVWHPWSLGRFDPEMRMLDQTFAYIRERRMLAATFQDFVASLPVTSARQASG